MRYIGGKALLLDNILGAISSEARDVESVIDIFSGSGVVGNALKANGYKVLSNDFLYFSYVLARGTAGIGEQPKFRGLGFDAVDYLNSLSLDGTDFSIEQCFVYNNYSPNEKCDRLYFQKDNALKIDIIRLTIEKWRMQGTISEDEYFYLLAALLNAVPYVANIAGVFGAYLKFWDKRTYKTLTLERPRLTLGKKAICTNVDYTELLEQKYDLLYADPPYNSREYLPNYHVLETIAKYDYPELHGVTGMRNYDNCKSAFCKKSTAYNAFEKLIRDCQSRYLLISYNNEGIVSEDALSALCKKYAVGNSFKVIQTDYRRYKNKIPNNKEGLKEQLYFLRRN